MLDINIAADTELGQRAVAQFSRAVEVNPQVLNHGQRFQWRHGERDSGRDGLYGKPFVEVFDSQSRSLSDRLALMFNAEDRFDLGHLTE